jgi:hypothetical protein
LKSCVLKKLQAGLDMQKNHIAICAAAALGLCLMGAKGASAVPTAGGADKVYAQTVTRESVATPVRWAGRAGRVGWGGRRAGLRYGVGWRGRGWRRAGLGYGVGWRGRGWGWRRAGWRRGYYGGWGGYGLGLGFGLGTGWGYGGSYAATSGGCYRGGGCYRPCGCGGLFGGLF